MSRGGLDRPFEQSRSGSVWLCPPSLRDLPSFPAQSRKQLRPRRGRRAARCARNRRRWISEDLSFLATDIPSYGEALVGIHTVHAGLPDDLGQRCPLSPLDRKTFAALRLSSALSCCVRPVFAVASLGNGADICRNDRSPPLLLPRLILAGLFSGVSGEAKRGLVLPRAGHWAVAIRPSASSVDQTAFAMYRKLVMAAR